MAIRSKDDCEGDIGELFPDLLEAVNKGNHAYWDMAEGYEDRLSASFRARGKFDLTVSELRSALDGRPGISIRLKNGSTDFHIKGKWLMKFHKFDEADSIALNTTQSSLDFNENVVEQLTLGEMPEETVIFLGYKDSIADRFAPDIQLTCPDGDEPAWVIELGKGSAPPPAIEITPAPEGPDTSPATKIVPRVDKRKFGH